MEEVVKTIKAYTHRESCDGFLPDDVLRVLGAPTHARQGRLLVFAPTAAAAHRYCVKLDLHVRNARDLRIATGNDLDALINAGYGADGNVLAIPLDGRTVASLRDTDQGERVATLIGEVKRSVSGRYEFIPIEQSDWGNI